MCLLAGCGPYAALAPAVEPTDCDVYCAAVLRACGGAQRQFADAQGCAAACAGYAGAGAAGDMSGDTLQCRLTYAAAARESPVALCGCAGPQSPACSAAP